MSKMKNPLIVELVSLVVYKGLRIVDTNEIVNSGNFIMDFFTLSEKTESHALRIKTSLKTYLNDNYPDPYWVIKYYDPEKKEFFTIEEMKTYYKDRMVQEGDKLIMPLKGFSLSVVKAEWNTLDDLLDYYNMCNEEEKLTENIGRKTGLK